ncbi:hypothetical protein Zm00014a_006953 [Zea mays]|jgi:hypothetical protein|uniref:Uncharacterized protein n=2 Tax=Zea mays TaxID=4577 RepID=K7V5C7_MAIZE|nr:uncharacterized protein LOC100276636 precursor [Zea mays]AQK98058.1 hypothetical protein ZEAMMB73_Zm00001d011810 [Zea mays]PWZ11694.1 hypothetical protein Zm00014a_006953 [Zea mays]|eukprot:XP_023156590.1 uncharacterized protein LOC100276636 [Zea mays]
MAAQSTRMVALALVVLLVAATALVPTATAYGCYDDCYERCANGKKDDPACTKMCNQACGSTDKGAAAGAPA